LRLGSGLASARERSVLRGCPQSSHRRPRPESIDLASRIDLDSPAAIIDLGCGPGNSTRVLRERWPAAQITGLDFSTAMIEKARQSSDSIVWKIGDIHTWYEPNRFDLIFANASLHWIDDHESLTKRLLEAVKRRGFSLFRCRHSTINR
jgi:trans-aconitate 2-methyltransferase